MPQITLLGSAATLAGPENDSIYLLMQSVAGDYLLDCGGSPPYKLAQVGADLSRISGVLLTHDHSDHIYGFPLLVQALLLLSWEDRWSGELLVWGLPETLATARTLLETYRLAGRIPIDFCPLAAEPGYPVLENEELCVTSTPVNHSRPTVGVRIEGKTSGRVIAYSSDTSPCSELVQLAAGADILLHEASVLEPGMGHSTAGQAGETAARAGVKRLVLVHFDPARDRARLEAEATRCFGGPVEVGRDWMTFDL
jgi:ribonuclease Z